MAVNQTNNGAVENEVPLVIWRLGGAAWVMIALAGALIGLLYLDGIRELLYRWGARKELNYGYFIPLISLFLVWQNRNQLARIRFDGAWMSVAVLLVGLFLYFLGILSTIFMIVHYSLIIVLFSLTLSFTGWQPLRYLWAALLLLTFAIPFPPFLLNQLLLALQLASSEIGVAFIRIFGISVFIEGNVIDLGTYQVSLADACSGLRYLFPLMGVGFLVAYFLKAPLWQRLVIFVSTIPVTVLMSSFRIGLIGLLVDNFSTEAADKFLHNFDNWIFFTVCTGILLLEAWLFVWFGGQRRALGQVFGLTLPERWPVEARPALRTAPRPFIMALVLLLGAAIGAQLLAARPLQMPERTEFTVFPDRIGEWDGTSSTLDARILESLDLDDYYVADFIAQGGLPVNFYVAYYGSQLIGEAAHSPRSCIPGDGWKIEGLTTIALDDVPADGKPLRVNRMLIQKGRDRQLVYYWFQQRDRLLTNEYAVKWFLFWDALTRNRTDGALIRLMTPILPTEEWEAGDQRLSEFARTLYPELTQFLPDS